MKYYIVLAILVFAAVTADESCKDSKDCGKDKCCLQTGFSIFKKGKCQPKGEEGHECNDDDEHGFEIFRYKKSCPCKDGLVCEEQEKTKQWERPPKKCVKKDTVEEPEGEETTTKVEEPEGEEIE